MFNIKNKVEKTIIETPNNFLNRYATIITVISIIIGLLGLLFKIIAFSSTFNIFQSVDDTQQELLNFGLNSEDSALLLNRKIIPVDQSSIPFDFIKYM